MKTAILGAAAALAVAVTNPAGAQEVIDNPGYCAQFYPNANCQNKGPGSPYWSGTAAAIATAPFAGGAYARRNGFACTPGTHFRGDDGRIHVCR